MRSLNHSYNCAQIMRQLLHDDRVQPFPELTLDIDNGLTPDISIYEKATIRPDFLKDVLKVKELPISAVKVISPSQSIQSILEESEALLRAGVKTTWTIEPFGKSIFVTSPEGKKLYHEDTVESEGVTVDFKAVFTS